MTLSAPLNGVTPISQARKPQGLVSVNGIYAQWLSFEVDNNNYYLADTFRVELPISGQPAVLSLTYFSSQPAIMVEVLAGFPLITASSNNAFSREGLDSLILGQVDDVTINLAQRIITLSGRDLTSKLIDAKTTEKFQNLSSSQIATTLAVRRGLTPVVTATTVKAGTYYEIDHARLTDSRTEWDLLTYLAHEENFVVFVKGKSLYFQPKPQPTDAPYVIQYSNPETGGGSFSANVISIEVGRNLTLAKDVIVYVHSWNPKQKKGFTKKAQATHNKNTVLAGAAQPIGDAQTYNYVFPNLTPEQALQKAQNLLKQISEHEMRLTATLPADNLLTCQNILQLKGTHSNFDQIYYPNSVIRRMSMSVGYSMDVEAKNHSPDSEVLA